MMTHDALRVVEALMADLDCPRSLTVAILCRYEQWDQIASLKATPVDYLDSESYWAASMATDLLRKCADLPTTLDLDAITLDKWWQAERQCFVTNRRFDELLDRGPLIGDPYLERVGAVLASVRKNLEWLIGEAPPSTWEGAFGPGATVSDRSGYTTVPDKMSSVPTLTRDALFHLVPWTGTLWAKAQANLGHSPSFVRGNVYFTVPKDSTTHRPCAKEPSLNAYYQRGLGLVMAERLRARGIDLKDGKRVHMLVACRASQTSDACTIDLSSASDTIAHSVVNCVFPRRWASALNSLRSPMTRINNRWVRLEKFSSMGNGFTFELETALFTAICMTASGLVPSARQGRTLLVFGDDIIVDQAHSEAVINLLKFFGFTPNERKTFLEGPFRESCGGDYWCGVAVRPHFIEKLPREPHEWISLANGLRRASSRRFPSIRRTWFKVVDQIPIAARHRGPVELGDTVIHDDESRWSTKLEDSIRYVRTWSPVRHRKVGWWGFGYDVQMASILRVSFPDTDRIGVAAPEKDRYLIPRDGVLGYGPRWVAFS